MTSGPGDSTLPAGDEIPDGELRRLRTEVRRLLDEGETLVPVRLAERYGVDLGCVRETIADETGVGEDMAVVGDHEILGEIGRGAMGIVYRARRRSLGRIEALKILPPFHSADERAIRRFRREAVATGKLKHVNLVPVYDFGEHRGTWYYSMELVKGLSLLDLIRRWNSGEIEGAPSGDRALLRRFIERYAEVCDALHVAHEAGIVHRDVKPSNLLIEEDGRIRLTDFGLAKDLSAAEFTQTGTPLGTPLYMSPEQVRGGRVDRRSDVYGLGVTLYHALTLRAPYSASSVPEVMAKILEEDPPAPRSVGRRLPADLEAIVFKAVERLPGRRYATAADLADDLRRFVGDHPIKARPQGPLVRLRKGLRRRRRMVAAGLAALLMAGVVLAARPVAAALYEWRMSRVILADIERREDAARAMLESARAADPAAAVSSLKELLDRYSGTESVPEAWRLLGVSLLALERREEAQAAWAEAAGLKPGHPMALRSLLDLATSVYEESRIADARRVVEFVLAAAKEDVPEARLLSAEVAVAEGRVLAARRELDRLVTLEARLVPRRDRLAAILEDLLPAAGFEVPGDWNRTVVDRFLPDGNAVLLFSYRESGLFRLRDGRLVEVPIEGLPAGHAHTSCGSGDLDGDGQAELVLIWSDETASSVEEKTLEVWSLRGGVARMEFTDLVEGGDFTIEIGDADHDGDADLLLGMSYPVRGAQVFANRGGLDFDRLPEGDLADLREGQGSDGRVLIAGDLTGDGKNELVVSAQAFEMYAVAVYGFVEEEGTFRRLFRRTAGFPARGGLVDLDRDGRVEYVFGTHCSFAEDAIPLYPEFLRQGVHMLDWDPETEEFAFRPIEEHERLRHREVPGAEIPPGNFGFGRVFTGTTRSERAFLWVSDASHTRGVREYQSAPRVYLIGEGVSPGLALPFDASSIQSAVGDLDGKAGDEVVLVGPGTVTVLGLEGVPDPDDPANAESGTQVIADPNRLDVADLLRDIGLLPYAARLYRTEWLGRPESEKAERKRALTSLVEAYVGLRRFDEVLARLEDLGREHPETWPWRLLVEADCTLENGDPRAAFRKYRALVDMECLSGEDAAHAAGRARALAPWLETRRPFASFPEGWHRVLRITEPGLFRLAEDGVLHVRDTAGRQAMAFAPVRWHGGSFHLSMKVRLNALDWAQGIGIGFLYEEGLHSFLTGCSFQVGNTSAWTSGGGARWSTPWGTPGVAPCEKNLPVRAELTVIVLYVREEGVLRIVVRDDTGRCVANAAGPIRDEGRRYPVRFGVALNGQRRPGAVDCAVRDAELLCPASQPIEVLEGPVPILQRASALLALGRDDDAFGVLDPRISDGEWPTPKDRALAEAVHGLLLWRRSGGGRGPERVRAAAARAGVSPVSLLAGRRLLFREGEAARFFRASLGDDPAAQAVEALVAWREAPTEETAGALRAAVTGALLEPGAFLESWRALLTPSEHREALHALR